MSRDRMITQPIYDYATEARVALEEFARDVGTDLDDITVQHAERFRLRLVNAHGRGAKEERARLEYEMGKLRQQVNEVMQMFPAMRRELQSARDEIESQKLEVARLRVKLAGEDGR